MEVVLGHWDTWDDGAIIVDKKSGRYADPTKVQAARSQGQVLHLARAVHRAALAAGPSGHHPGRRQRPRPALRGTLGRGDLRRRAQHRAGARRATRPSRTRRRALGRDPDQISICNILMPVVRRDQGGGRGQDGDHLQAAARDRCAVAAGRGAEFRFRLQGHRRAVHDGGAAGHAGHARHPRRRARNAAARPTRARATSSISAAAARPRAPWSAGRRRLPTTWRRCSSNRGCDGFVVAATHVPGAYADFVRHVVPELQRRGLYHKDYTGDDAAREPRPAAPAGRRLEARQERKAARLRA